MNETIIITDEELIKLIQERQQEKKKRLEEICEKYRKELEDGKIL